MNNPFLRNLLYHAHVTHMTTSMYNILAGHHYQTDVHIVPCNLYHLPHTMCHMPYIGRLPLPDTLLSKFGGKTRWNIRKSTRDSRTQACVSSLIWNIGQINNSANISKTRWSIWTHPNQSELCASCSWKIIWVIFESKRH